MKDILVIGGSNIDYAAIAENQLIPNDSNIGKLEITYGGVGRNIVENLARLKNNVTFITAIGNDPNGAKLKQELTDLNVNVLSKQYDYPSGSYIAIFTPEHDMSIAVCDSAILDTMKEDEFDSYKDIIEKHDQIVLDANINEQVINHLFQEYPNHKFYVEAVSCNKVIRYKEHLKDIYLFKSNVRECQFLLQSKSWPHDLCLELMAKGVKNIVMTNGPKAITIGHDGIVEEVNIYPLTEIVSASGAGDSLFAGVLHGLEHGMTLKEAVLFGDKVAKITLMSKSAVNKDLYEELNK